MIVYVPVGSGPLREKYLKLGCGQISSKDYDDKRKRARPFRIPNMETKWIFDNGAFADWKRGRKFDEGWFQNAVKRVMALPEENRPEWGVCPDIVASRDSLSFSMGWRSRLPNELRWYLAIQDGMTKDVVHLAINRGGFDGLFIGGSSTWKNEWAWYWVELAHEWGMKAHLGRANNWRRLQWAVNIGADSIDGTGWTRNSGWVKHIEEMPEREGDEAWLKW